ncbi:hypothetical protein B0H16DRAFT_1735764 [Mycena metata]|uniref:Importin N-terminal domain-containing protein n=1 Tax=Mycena metata TaxID=1033252 RepID=A0AAD7MNZ7_9AGAR|nr:hypothetical protein B0H16DRAFT_1735764 [Mycena metata]
MSSLDVAHAIALIQAAYAPSSGSGTATAIQTLQSTLLAAQRTPAAWALVVPLLSHPDPNVQFFGAHTAHAKIARGELASLSAEEQAGLREALVGLAGVQGRTRVVRRKVYSAVVALAIRNVGEGGEGWEGWVEGTVSALAGAGAPSGHIHEFLAGAAEDVGSASLLPQPRIRIEASLRAAAPLVLQSISSVLASNSQDPDALPAALACLVAWLPHKLLPQESVAALVPPLISLLHTPAREAASTTLAELLGRPPSAWGPSVLLEPLLAWVSTTFGEYAPSAPGPEYGRLPTSTVELEERLKWHARLLLALAESAVEWVAAHLVDVSLVTTAATSTTPFNANAGGTKTRAELAQTLVRVMLALTAADPGGARLRLFSASAAPNSTGFGVSTLAPDSNAQNGSNNDDDAEEDDGGEGGEDEDGIPPGGPLAFWFALQEALWEVDVRICALLSFTRSSVYFRLLGFSGFGFLGMFFRYLFGHSFIFVLPSFVFGMYEAAGQGVHGHGHSFQRLALPRLAF